MMKKLMIAACAVALTCAAQAATTYVAYSVNYRNNDNDNAHYSHYLLTAAQAQQFVYGSTSQSVDLNALATKVNSLFSSSGYVATQNALSANSVGVGWSWFDKSDANFEAGGYATTANRLAQDLYENGGFAVCLYENLDDMAYVVADRNHISYEQYIEEDEDSVGFYLAGSYEVAAGETAAAWHTVASVPEPTSGLLMLLGMAGLALKRKRVVG